MRPIVLTAALALNLALADGAAPHAHPARGTLDIYFIDVEGGAATLIVTPSGESVLMDAGWSDVQGRDARRIQTAMQRAKVTRIDHLVASHYHMDHYGGVPDLAKLVPIGRFYDHGPMSVMTEDDQFEARYGAYRATAKNRAITLEPGAVIPLEASHGAPPMMLRVVASGGAVIDGKGSANAECGSLNPPADASENGRSIGLRVDWGAFQLLNLADLTWNVSQRLVCPVNQVGNVDLYQVTHHGGNVNNNPILLRSLNPTVAVMINGPRKGGHPDTVKWLTDLPSTRAVYQLHRNLQAAPALNTSPDLIANLEETPDDGHMITVSVDVTKGTFTVTNDRTREARSFPIK